MKLGIEEGGVPLTSRLASFDLAIFGRLILTGALLFGAIGVLRIAKPILRQETEVVAEPVESEGPSEEQEPVSSKTPDWTPSFGVGWTASTATGNADPEPGPRSALYSDGAEIFAAAITQPGQSLLADAPLFDIGPLQGWVIADPETNVYLVVVSDRRYNTTLSIAGLSRDEAVELAAVFFVDGVYGFLGEEVDGVLPNTDILPESFGGLSMIGTSQPGVSSRVPSEEWVVRRADASTASLEIYGGELDIQLAEGDLVANGAVLQDGGRLVTSATDFRSASVGWFLPDNRFAILHSSEIGLKTLLELVDVA